MTSFVIAKCVALSKAVSFVPKMKLPNKSEYYVHLLVTKQNMYIVLLWYRRCLHFYVLF